MQVVPQVSGTTPTEPMGSQAEGVPTSLRRMPHPAISVSPPIVQENKRRATSEADAVASPTEPAENMARPMEEDVRSEGLKGITEQASNLRIDQSLLHIIHLLPVSYTHLTLPTKA